MWTLETRGEGSSSRVETMLRHLEQAEPNQWVKKDNEKYWIFKGFKVCGFFIKNVPEDLPRPDIRRSWRFCESWDQTSILILGSNIDLNHGSTN